MIAAGSKDPAALRTIGELSQELGVAQHILRYWETRFPQLKPMQRAGNRRYYRPADVALARRIHRLLNEEGYTVRGVQKLLRSSGSAEGAPAETERPPEPANSVPSSFDAIESSPPSAPEATAAGVDVFRLIALRDRLAAALDS